MSRALKPASAVDAQRIQAAAAHLRTARELLKKAGAERTVARVRLALTSAGGAERHVWRRIHRTEKAARHG